MAEFKVAVCLSGQLRQWEIAHQNQIQFFGNNKVYEVDYFIHTWNYSTDRAGVSQPHQKRDVTQEEFDKLLKKYKPKKSIFDNKDSEDFWSGDWWAGLFYSFAQSVMLKRQYEIENNFEYDIVIKSRPDIVFDPNRKFVTHYLENNLIYTTHAGVQESEFSMFNVNDCCFYGNSYTMDLLTNLYYYRMKVVNGNSGYTKFNFHPLGPGTLMGEFFRDNGINYMTQKGWRETLIKLGCPTDLDLNNQREFAKLEKYFRNWYTK